MKGAVALRPITQADVLAAVGRVHALRHRVPPRTDYERGWNHALDLAYHELLDAITTERTPA